MSRRNDNTPAHFSSFRLARKSIRYGRLAKNGMMIMALSLGMAVAHAVEATPNGRPPFPSIQLPGKARGANALQALRDKLPEVAAHYRMTPERLSEILQKDKNAWVDKHGRLLFVDDFPPLPATDELSSIPASAMVTPAYSLAETFLRNTWLRPFPMKPVTPWG